MSQKPSVPKNASNNPSAWLIILGLVLFFLMGVGAKYLVFNTTSQRTAQSANIDGLLWPTEPLKEFNLSGSEGDFTLSSLQGKWSLLFFGYLSCPDICPMTLSTLAQSLDAMRLAGDVEIPQVILVSVDPARDSADKMKPYVQYFDSSFIGATASDVERLNQLTNQLYVPHSRGIPDKDGNYEVSHGASILVIDPMMRRVGLISTPHTAQNIVERYMQIQNFVNTQS